MSDVDLGERFPELRPIRRLPSLWSINGCGPMLYGKRAHDGETDSFLQTHCLCFVFIPVLALAAYRVVWADGQKYILGRERLSGLARGFNALVLLAALGLGGYAVCEHYITSPASIARHRLAEAGRRERGGEHAGAAQPYAEVVRDEPGSRAVALQKLDAMLRADAPGVTASERSEVSRVAARLLRDGRWPEPSEHLYGRGMVLVDERARSDPGGAWMILEAVAPLSPRDEGVGSESEARAMAEEAYSTTNDAGLREQAAILRGPPGTEVDDRIDWLCKGNPTEPWVRTLLGDASPSRPPAKRRGGGDPPPARDGDDLRLHAGVARGPE